jgi:hypothetical protein
MPTWWLPVAVITPSDAVLRHRWLFEQQWSHELAIELEAEEANFEAWNRRVATLREEALLRLCASSGAAHLIGHHLARTVLTREEAEDVARRISAVVETSAWRIGSCLSRLLAAMDTDARVALLQRAVDGVGALGGAEARVADALLRCAPFGSETWAFVDRLPPARRARYWQGVFVPPLVRESPDEVNRAIDELLGLNRPRTAFKRGGDGSPEVTSGRLMRLLHEAATDASKPTGQQHFRNHGVSDASRSCRSGWTSPEMSSCGSSSSTLRRWSTRGTA